MGCDIHINFEVKINDKWEPVEKFVGIPGDARRIGWYVPRNYLLFTYLAGVRDQGLNIPRLAPPRGLPLDCSLEIKGLFDPDFFHTPSWLDLEEIPQFFDCTININDCHEVHMDEVTRDLQSIISEVRYYTGRLAAVRMVFWFDN